MKGFLVMDCFNVTEYGALAKDYIVRQTKAGNVQVMAFLETHIPEEKEAGVKDWLQKATWRSIFATARATGKSEKGTHGGALVISRKHLHCTAFEEGRKGKGRDWAAIRVRVKGMDILYVAVYLTCGIGATGENILKIKEVMAFVMVTGLPFILVGDWNMSPEETLQAGWTQKLDAEVIVPKGVTGTCLTGSTLDYAIISKNLRPIVQIEAIMEGPWKKHCGIRTLVHKTPRVALARTICAPKRLDKFVTKNDVGVEPAEVLKDIDAAWKEGGVDMRSKALTRWKCVGEGRWVKQQQQQEDWGADDKKGIKNKQMVDLQGSMIEEIQEDARQVGNIYASWSRRSEEWLIVEKGAEGEKGIRGRGQYAKFQVGPAFEKKIDWDNTEGGDEAQLWGAVGGCLRRLLAGNIDINKAKEFLKKKCEDLKDIMKKMKGDDREDMLELAVWIERIMHFEEQNKDIFEHMADDAEVRLRRAQGKRKRQVDAKVGIWVADICKGGMAKAHKFIKQEENFKEDMDEINEEGRGAKDMIEVMEEKGKQWKRPWTEEEGWRKEQLRTAMTGLRQKAMGRKDRLKRPTLQQVKQLLRELKDERALGIDMWAPRSGKTCLTRQSWPSSTC